MDVSCGTLSLVLANDETSQYISLSTYNSISASGAVDDPLCMLVKKDGTADGLCPDGHEERFQIVTTTMPNMQPVAAPQPASRSARSLARPQAASSSGSFLRMLTGVAKVAHVANQVLGSNNGGGGGGTVYYSGGGDGGGFDPSLFSAGLQQDTWASTSGAASDPIQ